MAEILSPIGITRGVLRDVVSFKQFSLKLMSVSKLTLYSRK